MIGAWPNGIKATRSRFQLTGRRPQVNRATIRENEVALAQGISRQTRQSL